MEILIPAHGRPYVEGDSLDLTAPLALTVPAVLSPGECAGLIDRIESLNPTAAPVSTPRGMVMMPDVRNNKRVVFDDLPLARMIFERLATAIPATLCGKRAVGANERFRCYRYEPGQRFAPHYDGSFARSDTERSLMTLMVYLNEGFTGGDTAFHDFDVAARPRTGTALLFQHLLLHEGCVVESGVKYALRSDVMYADS
jgi:prolyl 4-hydroxylase